MSSKVVGALILIAAILGVIFLIKFIPVYLGASELEQYFNECMSNYQQYGEQQCRDQMDIIIKKNGLSLSANDIKMDVELQREGSTISADWDQPLDFFGVYTYVHHFHVEHTGRPPIRT